MSQDRVTYNSHSVFFFFSIHMSKEKNVKKVQSQQFMFLRTRADTMTHMMELYGQYLVATEQSNAHLFREFYSWQRDSWFLFYKCSINKANTAKISLIRYISGSQACSPWVHELRFRCVYTSYTCICEYRSFHDSVENIIVKYKLHCYHNQHFGMWNFNAAET